jgi:hypothetical protein
MPMEASMFKVLSIGYLVRRMLHEAGSFEMHSQFRHALNLKSVDGGLLSLLGAEAGDFPTAIRLMVPTGWDWRDVRFDRPVVYDQGTLFGDGWSADLKDPTHWQPEVTRAKDAVDLPLPAYHTALAEALRTYVDQHGVISALRLLPDEQLHARAPSLMLEADRQSVDAGVRALVGYGSGLTPDGDDYLLGYIAALWPWRDTPGVDGHLDLIRQSIRRLLPGTTDISRHYLALALDGHFSGSVSRLISALVSGQPVADVVLLAHAVMRFGAASGVDTLAGVLHGTRTLQAAVTQCSV